jgi:ABC-2 type transport system permease protein
MHNLTTVIRFEITRTLKKKSFWIAALSVPAILGFVGLIIFFSNKASDEQAQNLASEQYSLGITDDSQLLSPELLKATNATPIASQAEGKQAVQSGIIDAYFYYPADISKEPVRVYGKQVGIFENSRYQSLADQLLQQSTVATASPSERTILKGDVNFDTVTYNPDGTVNKGFLELIAPGIFLVLFYFMIATFGNQMLTSVIEEKENRVIEMILATIKPTTLLVGKLLSLIALALIQVAVILVPVSAAYFVARDALTLPSVDLTQIPLDPEAIVVGAVIFFVSFLLFAGLLMTIGAAMPTAKEAGGFFGAAMTLLFGPLYAAPLFVTSPDLAIVQVLSYFPLTAPIPLLLRNAVGNLSLTEAGIAIALLLVATVVILSIGVRIFKFGALEYNRRLSVKEVMRRSR